MLRVFLGRHEQDGKGVTQLEYVIHVDLYMIHAGRLEFDIAETVDVGADVVRLILAVFHLVFTQGCGAVGGNNFNVLDEFSYAGCPAVKAYNSGSGDG